MKDSKLLYKVQWNLLQWIPKGTARAELAAAFHCMSIEFSIMVLIGKGQILKSYSPWELRLCYLPRCLQSRAKEKLNSAIDLLSDKILALPYKVCTRNIAKQRKKKTP